MRTKWVRLKWGFKSDRQMAAHIGRDHATVRKARGRLGIPNRRTRVEMLLTVVGNIWDSHQIAELTGYGHWQIVKIRSALNKAGGMEMSFAERLCFAAKHKTPMALSEDDVKMLMEVL